MSHPLLFAPTVPQPDRPLLVFLPGLDGTGRLLAPQVAGLVPHFDLRCALIPPDNRQGWDALADAILAAMEPLRGDRPLYLLGESFGGCLALHLALRHPQAVQHLILLNVASALRRHPWLRWASHLAPWVPDWMFRSAGSVTLPLIATFDRMAPATQQLFVETVRPIPQDCVAWRLSLLLEFAPDPAALQRMTCPALLLASDRDRLFDSHQEAQRLQRWLPQAQIYRLPHSGHGALLEAAVNLAEILAQTNRLPSLPAPALGESQGAVESTAAPMDG